MSSNVQSGQQGAGLCQAETSAAKEKRRMQKTHTGLQREFGIQLDSTEALVNAFNDADEKEKIEGLRKWIHRYSACFDSDYVKNFNDRVLEEIACLTRTKIRCHKDSEFVTDTLRFLCDEVNSATLDFENSVSALACALTDIDPLVFRGDATIPLRVSRMLLDKLFPGSNAFTEGTYPTHSVTLYALHQALILVHKIAQNELNPCHEGGLFQSFKASVRHVADCQCYFPSYFQVKLIEQSWEYLAADLPISGAEFRHRAVLFAMGCGYLYSGFRQLAGADIDIDLFANAYKYLKKATEKRVNQSSWYIEYLLLNLEAEGCCQNSTAAENLQELKKYFHEAMNTQETLHAKEKHLLRFGIVNRVRHVALNGKTSEARNFATVELTLLGTKYSASEGWIEEPAVVEAILDALWDVREADEENRLDRGVSETIQEETDEQHTHQEDMHKKTPREEVKIAFEVMEKFEDPKFQELLETWRNKRNAKQKTKAMGHEAQRQRKHTHLFCIVRRSIDVYGPEERSDKLRNLRSFYKSDDFVKVPALLDEESDDVRDFKFHIVCNECSAREECEAAKTDGLVVPLDELFVDRVPEGGHSAQSITKLLVYGNPYTGKTSLGKKIAHDWAKDKWGTNFEVVYYLRMDEMHKRAFKEYGDVCSQPALKCAIFKLCFQPQARKDEHGCLLKYINDTLGHKTTLVILDGLDESDDTGEEMFHEALGKDCSLLVLSRRCRTVEKYRREFEITMECFGLSRDQLLLHDVHESEFFLQKLRRYIRANPSLQSMVHVPLVAKILCCLLETEQELNPESQSFEIGLFELYERMTIQLLQCFDRKRKKTTSRNDVPSKLEDIARTLENIAYKRVRENKRIVFTPSFLRDHCSRILPDRLARSGFMVELDNSCLDFADSSFGMYFAGKHLAGVLMDGFEHEKRFAVKFIADEFFTGNHDLTISFLMQALCKNHRHNGLQKLVKIADETKASSDRPMPQQVELKLCAVEAFIASKDRLLYDYDSEEQKELEIVNEAITNLKYIKDEHGTQSDTWKETVRRILERVPRTARKHHTLFETVMEWPADINAGLFKALILAAGRIANGSNEHEEKLLGIISEMSSHQKAHFRGFIAACLKDVAEDMPNRKDDVLQLGEPMVSNDSQENAG